MTTVSSVWQISHLDLIIRMVLAVVLGGLIGLEREWNNHAAGFRTHILVCLGSATIMLLSEYGFSDFVNEPNVRIDPSSIGCTGCQRDRLSWRRRDIAKRQRY